MTVNHDRIEALVVARAHVIRGATSASDVLAPLVRFCPRDTTETAWRATLDETLRRLCGEVLDDQLRLVDADALAKRIGKHHATTWSQLADRVLPALALGVAPDDAKVLAKLSSRDAWAAAVVARARGEWTQGPPPSATAVCDAIAWQALGLASKPKRLPGEVRALFLQRELATSQAPADRLLRQLAARELDVPRTDARSLRDGLVRVWLAGLRVGPTTFSAQVHAVARSVRDGAFGDRKVFISEVWRELRRRPAWSAMSLDEFKGRLLSAHRSGELVLARADLVSAMSPEIVAASETVSDGASFHFIIRES